MKYSIETLYHFNCTECKNWWSYALTPDLTYTSNHDPRMFLKGRAFHCPHCGHTDTEHSPCRVTHDEKNAITFVTGPASVDSSNYHEEPKPQQPHSNTFDTDEHRARP